MIDAVHRAAAVAVSVLVLSGCGGSGTGTDGRSSAAPPSRSPSVAASPSRSPSPSPTGALPEAADGTDLDACYDGECEVLVTEPVDIPVDPAVYGFDTLSITAIEEDLVTVVAVVPGGFASVNIGTEGQGVVQGVTVSASAIGKEGAVLSISVSGEW
jgi:hypothetical protein